MRFKTILQAALLLALPACESSEDSETVTGACLYAAQAPLAVACMNQWTGDTTCLAVGAQAGAYQACDACDARGYAQPCTYDHPQSLWVDEEAACEAWMTEQEGD